MTAPGDDSSDSNRSRTRARRGVAPLLLLEQVRNTAAWALAARAEGPTSDAPGWLDALTHATELQAHWQAPEAHAEYLRFLLAAHFTTVATLVPTDVDTQIRHHLWQELDEIEALERAVAVVSEAASWDPRAVSARVIEGGSHGPISGHAGEWFSVRAGALGRALQLGARHVVDSLVADIDAELAREAGAHAEATRQGDAVRALSIATTVAHNTGDLSRVVEAWPAATPERERFVARYVRLGHSAPNGAGGELALAGHINKQLMAVENHRFLALRAPRGLRRSRELLLPIGPFFDTWGRQVGRNAMLDTADRGEVVAALVHGIDRSVGLHGYTRALVGIHESAAGGLDALASHVPARLRHHLQRGPVRDALRIDEAHFRARIEKAWRTALTAARRA